MHCTLCVGHGYEKLKATVESFLEFNGMAFNDDLILNKLLFVRRKRVDYHQIDTSYSNKGDKLKTLSPNDKTFIIGDLFKVIHIQCHKRYGKHPKDP